MRLTHKLVKDSMIVAVKISLIFALTSFFFPAIPPILWYCISIILVGIIELRR